MPVSRSCSILKDISKLNKQLQQEQPPADFREGRGLATVVAQSESLREHYDNEGFQIRTPPEIWVMHQTARSGDNIVKSVGAALHVLILVQQAGGHSSDRRLRDSSVCVLIKCRIDQNELSRTTRGRMRDTPQHDHPFRTDRAQQLFHVRM